MGRAEADVSSLSLFPLSLQDSLGAGPGKGIAVGQRAGTGCRNPQHWREGEAPSKGRKEL